MKVGQIHRMHARHLAALRRAPGTISYYGDCIRRLEEFLEARGLPDDAAQLRKTDLMDLMLWLRERGLSPGGEHAVMRGVRATLRWAVEEDLIGADPTRKLRLSTPPVTMPPAVTPQEAREALRLAMTTDHPLRDKAILLTMLDTGVRMGELLQLHLEDVDMERGMLRVRAETSKRQRERHIPFGVKLGRAISLYERRERRPARASIPNLFLNRSGMPLTKGVVEHLTSGLAERMGVPRSHLAPHAWRRAFATACLRGGVDIHALRLMMGHTSIEQTLVYARYVPDDLQRQHLRASPGDRL